MSIDYKKLKRKIWESVLYPDDYDPDDFVKIIKKNINYLEGLGVDFDRLYDCGGGGCAFATANPFITAKITVSTEEINFYEIAIEADSPIFPEIFLIKELALNCFIVLREAIIPMTEKDYNKIEDYIKTEVYKVSRKYKIGFYDIDDHNVGFSEIDGRPIVFDGAAM